MHHLSTGVYALYEFDYSDGTTKIEKGATIREGVTSDGATLDPNLSALLRTAQPIFARLETICEETDVEPVQEAGFEATHEFHLRSGEVVLVQAELRGDWAAWEEDGTPWVTNVNDLRPEWGSTASKKKRKTDDVVRVVKYGHRYRIQAKRRNRIRSDGETSSTESFRSHCECGFSSASVRSEERADFLARSHHKDACLR